MAGQEDLKLEMTLESADVESGLERVERQATELGPAAATAGDHAAGGLDKIANAAKKAGDALDGIEPPPALTPPPQAVSDWERFKSTVAELGPEFEDLKNEATQAINAVERLSTVADEPQRLGRAAGIAELGFLKTKDAIAKAASEGKKFGPEVAAAMQHAEQAISKATLRSGELRDAMGDVRSRGDLAARSFESAAGAAGSLDGLLGKLKDTAGPTGQKFADLGFQVLAVGAAFDMGYSLGTKFNTFLEQHGNYLAKAIDGTVNFVTGLKSEEELLRRLPTTLNTVLRAKQQLTEEMGDTLSGLRKEMGGWQDLDAVRQKAIDQASLISQRYTQLKSAGKDWRTEVELQAPAINATTNVLLKLGVDLASLPLGFTMASNHAAEFELRLKAAENAARLTGAGVIGLRDALAAVPQNLQDFGVSEVIDGLSKAIASAAAEGKGWNAILDEYRKELDLVRQAAYDAGTKGVDLFRKKILDLVPAFQAAEIATGGMSASTQRFLADITAQVEAVERYRFAMNELDIATQQWASNQQQMSNLSGQTVGFMKAAEESFKRTGEAIYTMTIMQTEMTHATEAQIEALRRMDEQLNATWDGSGAGQRALDQIAQMVDMFRTGVLSLDGFNKGFAYLEEQLDRVIKAGGDLDGELAKVLEALRKIAQQVRQGPGGGRPGGVAGY